MYAVEIGPGGREVNLRSYGWVKGFWTVSLNGEVEHWATNDLGMLPDQQEELIGWAWSIESHYRGLKQCLGVERCQAGKAKC